MPRPFRSTMLLGMLAQLYCKRSCTIDTTQGSGIAENCYFVKVQDGYFSFQSLCHRCSFIVGVDLKVKEPDDSCKSGRRRSVLSNTLRKTAVVLRIMVSNVQSGPKIQPMVVNTVFDFMGLAIVADIVPPIASATLFLTTPSLVQEKDGPMFPATTTCRPFSAARKRSISSRCLRCDSPVSKVVKPLFYSVVHHPHTEYKTSYCLFTFRHWNIHYRYRIGGSSIIYKWHWVVLSCLADEGSVRANEDSSALPLNRIRLSTVEPHSTEYGHQCCSR